MKEIEFCGHKYNEVSLKCGGHVYFETFDDRADEERCNIYDDNMNYWDYVDVCGDEILAHARYDKYIKYFEELEDVHNYLGAVLYSYTCGDTIEDLIDNMCDDMTLYYTDDELEDERRQMLTYLETCGEEPFCREYCIAKIGNLYVYSEG